MSSTSIARRAAVGFALALLCALRAPAPAATDPAILKPVDALMAAVVAGNGAGVRAAYQSTAEIVDEFPPFHWSGAGAATRWSNGFAKLLESDGMSQISVTRAGPPAVSVDGPHAYAVVPAQFSYVAAGKRQTERADWTFALVELPKTGWHIASSAWVKYSDTAPPDASADAALLAPVDAFLKAIGANEWSALAKTYTGSPAIVDEFSPYLFRGPFAVSAWTAGAKADIAQHHMSGMQTSRSKPVFVERTAHRAYLVVPVEYSAKTDSGSMHENAYETFVLLTTSLGWRAEATVWTTRP
jgi:hypothetical protein